MIRFGVSGKRRASITADADEPLFAEITSVAPGTLIPTETHQIAFTAKNRFYVIISSPTATYESSDTDVATVDSDGLVTAVADGSVTITVRISAIILTVALTVTTPVSTVTQVVVTGPTTVQEDQQITLTAEPRDAGGTAVLNRAVTWAEGTGAGDVTLGADSGIDPHQVLVTGVTDGTRTVIATCDGIDSTPYSLTVTNPPVGGGAYDTLAEREWYNFTSDSQLVGLIGVEANFNNIRDPVLPVIPNFASIVTGQTAPDREGVMGTRSVLRYHGDTALNTYPIIVTAVNTGTGGNNIRITVSAGTSSGRKWVVTDHPTAPTITETYDNQTRATIAAAVNGVSALITVNPNTNAPGITLPASATSDSIPATSALTGGAIGVAATLTFRDNISGRTAVHSATLNSPRYFALRTFFRFSSNWTTLSDTGGQGGGSHKLYFFRNQTARFDLIAEQARAWALSSGGVIGGGGVQDTALPHHNVVSMNTRYSTSGFPHPDFCRSEDNTGMLFTTALGGSPAGAVTGVGEEEWYELRWIHEQAVGGVQGAVETTQALRQYTQSNIANPRPWRFNARRLVSNTGAAWYPITRYEQGINRNRQWDATMWWDHACYEIVDLDAFTPAWVTELGIT